MNAVYVVIENGEPYQQAYASFASAIAAANEKHEESIRNQLQEANGEPICSDLNVPENKITGKTYLYVEKGINIYIHKLPVLIIF